MSLNRTVQSKSKEIRTLKKDNTELRVRLSKYEQPPKDSNNNSIPPSKETLKNEVLRRTYSLREKSDKPIGGQMGHEGHTREMSQGTISNIIQSTRKKVGPAIKLIKDYICKSTIVDFDKSGCYCNGRLDWSWIAQTAYCTSVFRASNRTRNVLEEQFGDALNASIASIGDWLRCFSSGTYHANINYPEISNFTITVFYFTKSGIIERKQSNKNNLSLQISINQIP